MRIASFDGGKPGIVASDDTVVGIGDLLQRFDPLGPEDALPDLIAHFDELRPELERRAERGGGVPISEAKHDAPFARPGKIICLMGNYREGTDRPLQKIDLFFKSPEGIIGDGDTVVLPPIVSDLNSRRADPNGVVPPAHEPAEDGPGAVRFAAPSAHSCTRLRQWSRPSRLL